MGTPQKGKASPALWRIGMNDLLRNLEKLNQTYTSAYAGDLAALVSSDSKFELQQKVDRLMRVVSQWCDESEVKLNVSKTEVINLSANNLKENLEINVIAPRPGLEVFS